MCRPRLSKRAVTFGLLPILIASLLAAGTLAVAAAASAKPLAQQKAQAKARMAEVKAQLEDLRVSLEQTIEQYNLATIKLTKAKRRVGKATRELKLARLQLAGARATLADRVVTIYKQGTADVVDIAFSAASFADLTSVLRDWSEIAAGDSQLVDSVERSVARVRTQRRAFVAARADAREYVAQVRDKRAAIESTIASQEQLYEKERATVRRIEKREAAIAAAAAARAAAAAQAATAAAATASSPTTATGTTDAPSTPTTVPTGNGHPEVIAIARHYLGVPYKYGGASPSTGFDCSGFVMYCYAQIGISLPHYSGYQQNMGARVSMSALLPGDLVFKGVPVSYHVGMYAGNGTVIHSPHTGDVVSYTPLAGWQYAVRIP